MIHVCLNGDIDNYLDLKAEHDDKKLISEEITTDTKIIPLQIQKYLRQGADLTEAFRLAVNDFQGSHAIAMHTNLAPGKVFLAQKGSGQAIFIGLAPDHYISASEVYGFVEETSDYLKVDGEKVTEGKNGLTQGQIFMLDQNSGGGLEGVTAMFYDGTPLELDEQSVKHTEITSRDTDRQGFPHYFLKEISEAPASVEKTLQNRWKIRPETASALTITLDDSVFPQSLRDALLNGRVRRIFFVGQGTAGVAAQACADILNYYMKDPSLIIRSLKASELSGFGLHENDGSHAMSDTLVVAISQSGTTTDTNRTVDMVRERGAYTLAIVNRRDSDITFKVDGTMYTSSGRDIEMSVASTKAFYSQIVAGAILSLFMAALRGQREDAFVTEEIRKLQRLPEQMRRILSLKSAIEKSASQTATSRVYWAAVGSGPNKTSADEIRIKLSELCYKTISSDFVEDKKHIDLSSEPLIIVCAAGTRETVIGDIIKDTAIFRAHKALPILIVNEGEDRFDPYAEDVFRVPVVSEHLAPIVNTLVGHIWGYYAALSINEGSRFLYAFREDIQKDIEEQAEKGTDVYELILEKSFREKIARFYNEFKQKKAENRLPSSMGFVASSDLTLLLKYLSGRLPVSDFELDFGIKGTALNMLNTLFECLGKSINGMARPVDAIKHQAKTVTVGTSRISEKTEGILFETLASHDFKVSQLTARNIIVLRNLQRIIAEIKGLTIYRVSGLNLLGEPTRDTIIEVVRREGTSISISSRVEKDHRLKGTKKILVQEGNVYVGKGRKDERSIILIPLISASPSTPNMIEYLMLLNISFREEIPLAAKVKALGGKYERIQNIVQESTFVWDDSYLELVRTEELFGISAEKIGEFIVSRTRKRDTV
ncbi:MAG: glutamine--fructose-6-phosphate aminotransferase [Desulfobacteraceae bacterium 4572_88]|nr:MAG: glutamine--fructose-6-phosphate aminotransferase [Desulfobacteraceae bacterium 4572_88]